MCSKKMNQVDFLVAGTQKGGTSALFHYLYRHPAIGTGCRKEIHFFDSDSYSDSWEAEYATRAYHLNFTSTALQKTTGDFTPIYMYWMPSAARIHRYNPNMKIVISLRNPADRAFSHWNMERHRGAEHLPFSSAIRAESERLQGSPHRQHRVYSYIDRGRYSEQLDRLFKFFPRSNIYLYRSEELATAPRETLTSICSFLGIPPPVFTEPVRIHETPYETQLEPRDREYIVETLATSIAALQRLTGWDLTDWLRTR